MASCKAGRFPAKIVIGITARAERTALASLADVRHAGPDSGGWKYE